MIDSNGLEPSGRGADRSDQTRFISRGVFEECSDDGSAGEITAWVAADAVGNHHEQRRRAHGQEQDVVALQELDESVDEFGDGDWIVGDQITPGRWRADGDDFCYWERASGFTHNFNEIIANSAGSQTIVDISPNDARFTSSGCGTWRPA